MKYYEIKEVKRGSVLEYENIRDYDISPLEFQTRGSACFDISYNPKILKDELLLINSSVRTLVPTGVKFNIPEGYFLQMYLRSSLSKKFMLANGVGIIDTDYTDEVFVPLVTIDYRYKYRIKAGERIAQMKLTKLENYEIKLVNKVNKKVSRDGGFGSTGKN